MNGFLKSSCLLFSSCLSNSCSTSEKSTQQNSFPVSMTEKTFMRKNEIMLPFWTSGSSSLLSAASEHAVIAMFDSTQGAATLRQIFEDHELLERFIIYATKKHASENVRFLKDYLNIKKIKTANLEQYYHELVINYLDEDAKYQINLPSDLAAQLQSKSSCYEDLLKIITRAADIAFIDLKLNDIFSSFVKEEQKTLTKSLNDYIFYSDHKTINTLLANPNYGPLIRFISMVQKFEQENPGRTKQQMGSKIFVSFVAHGSPFEISRKFTNKFYLILSKKYGYSALSDIRIEVIHYLLSLEDIVHKCRAWEATTTTGDKSKRYIPSSPEAPQQVAILPNYLTATRVRLQNASALWVPPKPKGSPQKLRLLT